MSVRPERKESDKGKQQSDLEGQPQGAPQRVGEQPERQADQGRPRRVQADVPNHDPLTRWEIARCQGRAGHHVRVLVVQDRAGEQVVLSEVVPVDDRRTEPIGEVDADQQAPDYECPVDAPRKTGHHVRVGHRGLADDLVKSIVGSISGSTEGARSCRLRLMSLLFPSWGSARGPALAL